MAASRLRQTINFVQQSPGGEVNPSFPGRFAFGIGCQTAADVRARAALVRAFRARVWPPRRQVVSYAPALLPTLRPPTPARADLSRQPADCGGAIQASAVPGRIKRLLDAGDAETTAAVEGITSRLNVAGGANV